jgi:hypothetical protein
MKAFLVLVVLSAAGLAGVLYWRRTIQAPRAAIVAPAAEPARTGKEHRRRRRRGARRLARNETFVASAPPAEAPVAEGASAAFAAPREERDPVPVAPGGSSTTEAAPSDVFGPAGPSPSPSPSGGRHQALAEPAPIKLRPADLKIVWQGEDLSRPETMRLDLSNAGGHDLSENEIDALFRKKEDAVLACIARARPDEDTYVPGRVTVKFRIQRTGSVNGVQVEAPVILHKGGLTGCIKGVMSSLRFPASSMSQVISYPFSLM